MKTDKFPTTTTPITVGDAVAWMLDRNIDPYCMEGISRRRRWRKM